MRYHFPPPEWSDRTNIEGVWQRQLSHTAGRKRDWCNQFGKPIGWSVTPNPCMPSESALAFPIPYQIDRHTHTIKVLHKGAVVLTPNEKLHECLLSTCLYGAEFPSSTNNKNE